MNSEFFQHQPVIQSYHPSIFLDCAESAESVVIQGVSIDSGGSSG